MPPKTGLSRSLLTRYLRPARARVALLAILLFASIGLQLVNPLLLRAFLDSAMAGQPVNALVRIAALFIAVAIAAQFVAVVEAYVAEDVGWTATNRLREDLAAHALALDMGFHYAHVPGELIQRLDYDVGTLANFFSRFVLRILAGALLLVGVLIVLTALDWRIGLVFTVYILVGLAALYRLRRMVTPAARADLETMGDLFGYIQERLAGREDIRSRGAIEYVLRGLYHHMGRRLRARRRAASLYALLFGSMDLVAAGGTALAFALGAYLYHSHAISIGTVFSTVYYLTLVAAPLNELTQQTQDFQQAAAGIGRIQELLETQPAVQDGVVGLLPAGPLPVAVENVSFCYQPGQMVLHDISFDVQAGQALGVLGRTGSGKTTLTRLVSRLHDPVKGEVRLGRVDVRDVRQRELRDRVGTVSQEVQLFHASLRDNVTLFDRTIPDDRILDTLGMLELGEWYASLPDGLDTELAGDAGLSAGEAQLLALTRIFLRNPGLVVLDEPSSRLDPATERRIESAIDILLRNRTAIIVAHRLATLERVDQLLILENGQIVEQGNRAELAADPGSRYAGLLRTGLEVAR